MLPKSRRLTGREVRLVLAKGRGKRGTLLSLKTLSMPDSSKAAVVVSRKVAKSAVVRNELRRLLYRGLGTIPFPGRALVVFLEKVPGGMAKKARNEALSRELKTIVHT